jgi:hypothetical protein
MIRLEWDTIQMKRTAEYTITKQMLEMARAELSQWDFNMEAQWNNRWQLWNIIRMIKYFTQWGNSYCDSHSERLDLIKDVNDLLFWTDETLKVLYKIIK